MKNTKMSLSEFRMKINTALLKRIGTGEETYIITSHGFPVVQVIAIEPPKTWTVVDPVIQLGGDQLIASSGVWGDTSTTNTAPSVSVTMDEAVARQVSPPGYLTDEEMEDAADIKVAQEVEHEDTVSSEQAKKELGLDPPEVKKIPFVTTTPGRGKRTGFEYSVPLPECSLEMLETLLTNTKQTETIERAKIMTAIVKHRPFTATETEIYRQLMAPFIPPPSDDGT